MIAIRVDTLCGMGHFMRCKWLAVELQARGKDVIMLVDSVLSEHYTKELKVPPLKVTSGASELEDADNCIKLFKEHKLVIATLIVDSYRLGKAWERYTSKYINNIIAIDDLERDHCANLVIDSKWCGSHTAERYKEVTTANTVHLLGPDYAMLAPAYRHRKRTFQKDKRVMFSLGGGGNWEKLTLVVRELLNKQPSLNVDVVFGPKAEYTQALRELANDYPQLQVIEQPSCLAKYYQRCSLFVGALGTSLYELAALHTPALTFAIAKNQSNSQSYLDDLGHYFHIDDLLDNDARVIANLVSTLLTHINRVAALRSKAVINVDGLGARRVVEAIFSTSTKSHTTQIQPSANDEAPCYDVAKDITITAVTDNHINRYLAARNRVDNAWRMTITKKIHPVEHYCWWFNNCRESFVMAVHGKPVLYIWHQLHQINGKDYLVGGWFAASQQVSFIHAQLALEWQLTLTKEQYPKAIWLAVINKENKFVNLLNHRAGFVAIDKEDEKMEVTKMLFPQATLADFHFVAKEVNK